MAPETLSSFPASDFLDDPCLTHEHRLFRSQVRRFLDDEVRPHAEAWGEGRVPREAFARMGALGLLGARLPEEHGGSAMDTVAGAVWAEELGRSAPGGFAGVVLAHTDMASPLLASAGTPGQQARWLPGMIAGRTLCAAAVADAGPGVAARRDGDDWVLNGVGTAVAGGALADLVLVAARTGPAAEGDRGLSIFAVEAGAPGFGVGRVLEGQGWPSSGTAELAFRECRVPRANLLGGENRGAHAVMRHRQNERVVLGAQAVGEAQAVLAATIGRARERRAPGAAPWDSPAIRQTLAMLSAEVEAARRLLFHAAWLHARNRDCVREVSMARALCVELAGKVLHACRQVRDGGGGWLREGGATGAMLEEVAECL